MSIMQAPQLADHLPEPAEVLIKEARQRQRRRWMLVFGIVVALLVASIVASTVGSGGSRPGGVPGPARSWVHPTGQASPTPGGATNSAATLLLLSNQLSSPAGLAVDAKGDLYIADTYNERILEVSPSGAIATVASGLQHVQSLAVDARGDVYVTRAKQLIEVTPSGTTYVIGTFHSAPSAVAVDVRGDVYADDSWNDRIVEIRADGGQTTIAKGTNNHPLYVNSLAVDAKGDLYGTYLAPILGRPGPEPASLVLKITHAGTVSIISKSVPSPTGVAVGPNGRVYVSTYTGIEEFRSNGRSTLMPLSFPSSGVAVDANNTVFASDSNGNRVVEMTALGPRQLPISGFNYTTGIAVGPTGNLYVGTQSSSSVVRVGPSGTQTSLYSKPIQPLGIATDNAGDVFVVNANTSGVTKISPTGTRTVVYPGFHRTSCCVIEGLPEGLATNPHGDLFIAGFNRSFVIEVTPQGQQVMLALHTVFPRIAIDITEPTGLAVGDTGTIYVVESALGGSRILVRSPTGKQTIIGSGLSQSQGIAVNAQGDVFVADSMNNRVEELLPSGQQLTVAGDFTSPAGLSVDESGDLYVAAQNGIFEITPSRSGSY
jgi:sugar lactone lactonase YvrE